MALVLVGLAVAGTLAHDEAPPGTPPSEVPTDARPIDVSGADPVRRGVPARDPSARQDGLAPCAVGPMAPPRDGTVYDLQGRALGDVHIDGGGPIWHLEGQGVGLLVVDGFAPIPLTWRAGESRPRCPGGRAVLAPRGTGWGFGRVAVPDGARAWVQGCGTHADVDADGSFSLPLPPVPCTVEAFARADDALWRSGDGWVSGGSDDVAVLLPPLHPAP